MARREELGHPLGTIAPPAEPEPVTIHPEASTSGRTADSADFVLEVGSEELPPDDVMTAVQQLRCTTWSIACCHSCQRPVIEPTAYLTLMLIKMLNRLLYLLWAPATMSNSVDSCIHHHFPDCSCCAFGVAIECLLC